MEETKRKIDISSFFIYLILYSIIGFLIETAFGIFTKGVIESRKSFLYGPFCAIYGIGAVVMIYFLKNEKNIFKVFFKGAIIGAFVEYSMSFICEKIWGVKWWDYSDAVFNIHGRTCLVYAISWGLLAIFLVKFINPYIDGLIYNTINNKTILKLSVIALIIFFIFDAVITGYVLKVFCYRIAVENNLCIENKEIVEEKYDEINNKSEFAKFINNYYNDEKMLKTYPNMMIIEKNNNDVYIESLLNGMKSYYYRLGDARK